MVTTSTTVSSPASVSHSPSSSMGWKRRAMMVAIVVGMVAMIMTIVEGIVMMVAMMTGITLRGMMTNRMMVPIAILTAVGTPARPAFIGLLSGHKELVKLSLSGSRGNRKAFRN